MQNFAEQTRTFYKQFNNSSNNHITKKPDKKIYNPFSDPNYFHFI